ncbi:pentapeptide repeat-containing protein [Microcoleus sp. LEGE 07076]|uniref:pentapeptide repeat-containing protein n=1 Tax=Microcoleus sp. LEGE 07076 TaxID=915322 RepID=UPI0018821EF3|nr:pentapeptide repeat-containing protein [Microcoleus sp. LEGE 07076]MBE9184111.1 pentapeptide repeat-containing protein [Microcoleus sp. LEGE 07076]
MASPTAPGGINQPDPSPSWQAQSQQMPLLVRRCGAWAVEISLIAASALVPFSIGSLVNKDAQTVPLNSSVAAVSETVARILGIPVRDRNPRVAPLTNLFWSGALLAPAVLAAWQLFLLARTGQTLPKRWFAVKVVTASGTRPGFGRVLLRESLGRWGVPLGIAYGIWRLSGAFPDLIILGGLSGLAVLADGALAFRYKRQSGHDRLANTLGVNAREAKLSRRESDQMSPNPVESQDWTEEDAQIAALVVTPETNVKEEPSLWNWMRQHPGTTLVIVTIGSAGLILSLFVGTLIYTQSQANLRDSRQRNDELFVALVSKLSPASASGTSGRRSAILALGAVEDSRAVPLLADLLAQEDSRPMLDAIQQALVSTGPKALPDLRRLNQALSNDLESLRFGGKAPERELAAARQRTVQRAIGKILTVYSSQLNGADLSRTDLSQSPAGPAQFLLVLDKVDLSGIKLRNTNLTNASLQGTRFYGTGEDRRPGTFDDWISDLSAANFEGANLTGASLNSAVMNRTTFVRAVMNKANLSNGILNGANLSSALLIGANLQQAMLKDASFTGADIGSANFSEANLSGARLGKVKAQGTQLSLTNLSKSEWQGADLSGADLNGANLQNADLSSAKLANANFKDARLQDANLQNADLSSVDFRGANLAGANFKGAVFLSKAGSDQFIQSPVGSKSGRFQGVDFADAKNLDRSQIAYICLQGGFHPKCPPKN